MKLRLEFTAEEWQALAEERQYVGTCGHLTLFHDREGWCTLCDDWAPPAGGRRPIRVVYPVEIVLPDPPIDIGGNVPAKAHVGRTPVAEREEREAAGRSWAILRANGYEWSDAAGKWVKAPLRAAP